ncbi:hypothetical protein D3C76_1340220 [compost metagenome]
MNDVLLRMNVAAINVREGFVIANAVGNPAGDGPGSHHCVKRMLVVQSGADRGGNHIKQATHDGRTRRKTGQGGCLSGDFPANFC